MQLLSKLYEKNTYVAPYEYLIDKIIREYDLEKANINILIEEGLISKSQYDYYAALPKRQREVEVGILQRDNPSILSGLKRGFVRAREEFFRVNAIEDSSILYIDKDSITTIEQARTYFGVGTMQTRLSEYLNFRLKNEYTSFYRVFLVDFLYFNDGNTESFRIKNASERVPLKHMHYMMDLLLSIAYSGQSSRVLDTLQMIKSAYCSYTSGELDPNFYREFNQRSQFKLKSNSTAFQYYSDVLIDDLDLIDKTFNMDIIRLFYRYYMNEYFKTKR